MVEVSVAIMSACLPPLGPLLTWALLQASYFRLGSGAKKESDENTSSGGVPTIGGSGNKKRFFRDPDTLNLTVGDTVGFEDSFLPEGYRATGEPRVQGGAPDNFEFVPLNRIAVKTDMSSREIRLERGEEGNSYS
jgi:hypothetical protein